MKTAGLQVLSLILVLSLTALACAAPGMVDDLLNPLPSDDFSKESSGWGIGTDSQSSVEYVDGGLQMIVYQPFFVTWSNPNTEVYENVHIEAGVKNASTDPKAFFGILCNEQIATTAFYYVGVSPNGYYAFIESTVTGDKYLKEGTSELISGSADSVRLGLDCSVNTLALYVNGQLVDSTSAGSLPGGSLGLFAATDELSNGANVTFDDFAVTPLGE